MRVVNSMDFYKKYSGTIKRHLSTGALVLGFVWDSFTLGRQDSVYGNVVILSYLFLAAVGIILINLGRERFKKRTTLWLTALVQFCFGNLASGLFVLYSQSATLTGNWPFFFILGGFAVGNEFARSKYARIYFQISVLYLLLFAYSALALPVFLGEMGPRIFFYSGIVSVGVLTLYLVLFRMLAPQALSGNRTRLYGAVFGIFVVFNGLYFLNLIPPVPLVLKDVGIFHSAVKIQGGYWVSYEAPTKYEFFKRADVIYHAPLGVTAYCFSSVFAPDGLAIPINHRWEYYDAVTRDWKTASLISFPISGGREEGYRGVSEKSLVSEGKWRCNVETNQGALVGRHTITFIDISIPPLLVTETR